MIDNGLFFAIILVYLKLEIFIHAKKISDRPCNDITM